jgi:hypothetical protein
MDKNEEDIVCDGKCATCKCNIINARLDMERVCVREDKPYTN